MKKRLKIKKLEIQSFVTTLKEEEKSVVKGAIMSADDYNDVCRTYDWGPCGGGGGATWDCTVNCQTGGQCTI